MRALGGFYGLLTLGFGIAGVVVLALGATGTTDSGMIIGGSTFLFMALVFGFVGRFIGSVGGNAVKDGIPATGDVLAVRDTGVSIGEITAIFGVRVRVNLPGSPPYEAECKIPLGRHQWGTIQPGMNIALFVERSDHSKVAYDDGQAGARTAEVLRSTGKTVDMDEYSLRGVATHGTIKSVRNLGVTAGQVKDGLPAHEADDPLAKIRMTFTGPMGKETKFKFVGRLPDGKAGYIVPGARVPVRYLPESPEVGSIDWDRLG